MNITYIHHSSFFVELESCCFLFDYYNKGELPKLPEHKRLYVAASHRHEDHFHQSIFEIRNQHPRVTYLLSDDISCKPAKDIQMVSPNQSYAVDDLLITTLKSSDEGVAFLIEAEGSVLYHAGDLNWWHWDKENSDEENEEAKQLFCSQVAQLKGTHIDVAFLPLDPRQKKQFYYGFDTFMRTTDTDHAFPMHFWKRYTVIEDLKAMSISAEYRDKIMVIEKENQRFSIEV